MTNYILFDDNRSLSLRPLTFFRPVAELRVGILTITQKWELWLGENVSWLTVPYLSAAYPAHCGSDNVLINASLLPDPLLVKQIRQLKHGQCLVNGDLIVAWRMNSVELDVFRLGGGTPPEEFEIQGSYREIVDTWDIFRHNGAEIISDFGLLTSGRNSVTPSSTNRVLGNELFIEEGAVVECSNLNTLTGPIYIGKGAVVEEGTSLRGPLALGLRATVRMGATIYGNTTIGPYCKVGGEVTDTVFTGFSNKAHDGFVGHSVIGEWCNLGAGTTTSNLKNNFEQVKQWSYAADKFVETGLQFCGLVIGDHSKTGIHSMFNSGTIVGVCSNVFGAGYQRNFIPSFAWGGISGFRKHKPEEVIETASVTYSRRNKEFTHTEKEILMAVHAITQTGRRL